MLIRERAYAVAMTNIGARAAVIVALAILLLASRAGAVDFNVTRQDDPLPDGCAVGDCSLREAVIDANADGADRILLPDGTYTLSLAGAGEDLAATGDLDLIANDIEIRKQHRRG